MFLFISRCSQFADRAIDRANERPSDQASDRGIDRATERSTERPSERPHGSVHTVHMVYMFFFVLLLGDLFVRFSGECWGHVFVRDHVFVRASGRALSMAGSRCR